MKQRFGPALALLLAVPCSAQASVHEIKIVEVFPGTELDPSAEYVVLQMYSAFQNQTTNATIDIYNKSNVLVGGGQFPSTIAQTASQTKILIATQGAATLFNVTPNLVISPGIIDSGGKICFVAPIFDTIDCVAFGDHPGSPISAPTGTSVGKPFRRSVGGLQSGSAMKRRIDLSGSASLLEGADDTGNSKNDFVEATPAPTNSAGTTGTIPPSTCGNNVLESLEQCDVGDTMPGDGCDALCRFEPDLLFQDNYEGF